MNWRLSDAEMPFSKVAGAAPGWYWIYRPRHVGPQAYDTADGILCMVFVSADGSLISPLADFTDIAADKCFDSATERHYGMWFAGPVERSPQMTGSVSQTGSLTGDTPAVPGWHWCKTNDEAPLLLVDSDKVGPIFLDTHDSELHVFLATGRGGQPIDVGEFGFSEPLVSEGGVIDSTGMLNRNRADFFGPVSLPSQIPDSFPVL